MVLPLFAHKKVGRRKVGGFMLETVFITVAGFAYLIVTFKLMRTSARHTLMDVQQTVEYLEQHRDAEDDDADDGAEVEDGDYFEIVDYGNFEKGFKVKMLKQHLQALQDKNPKIKEVFSRCIEQLDDINADKARLKKVSKTFGGISSEDLLVTINKVEQEICQNIDDILNLCLLADSDRGKATYDKLDKNAVEEEFSSNETKLRKTDSLIHDFIIMTNQHDNEQTNMDLDTWEEVIKKKNTIYATRIPG